MAEPEEISIADELERLARADPFAPFSIVMASGQRYEVGGGDSLAFGRTVVTLVVHRGGSHLLRQSQISEVSVPGELP